MTLTVLNNILSTVSNMPLNTENYPQNRLKLSTLNKNISIFSKGTGQHT